jgi:Tfp pilus assembly protein FimV
MGRQTEATAQTATDYPEHALEDLNQARQGAQAEMRAAIESAAERTSEVLQDLKGNVTGRAEELHTRHKEQTWEWQRDLEEASDVSRLDLGIKLVRAQRTSEALDADEIKRRKKELPWGA